jgi:hypothetical protein
LIAYAQKTWYMLADGKNTLQFGFGFMFLARGGVNYQARAVDTDHDGTISKDEYVAYATRKFEGMKKTDNMVSVDEMARAFARGNT